MVRAPRLTRCARDRRFARDLAGKFLPSHFLLDINRFSTIIYMSASVVGSAHA
jgi:hypothetical protein